MPSEPVILAFDTSAAHCAAALLCGDKVIASHYEEMSKGQAERLFPLLNELLEAADISWPDLTRIAVATGPGNFTGIRIGVAAARGLSLSLSIPAIGITNFEIARGEDRDGMDLVTTVPAPRAQVYMQHWKRNEQTKAPALVGAEQLPTTAPIRTLEDIPLLERVERLGRLASEREAILPYFPPVPCYIRAADAAPARDAPPVILSNDT